MPTIEIGSITGSVLANAADTTWHLAAGAKLDASAEVVAIDALTELASRIFRLDGWIDYGNAGVQIGNNGATQIDNRVVVGKTGWLSGNGIAIELHGGGNSLVNYGTIQSANQYAIAVIGDNGHIVNAGLIDSGFGIYLDGDNILAENRGSITGTVGFDCVTNLGETLRVENSGTLTGWSFAFMGGGGNETVVNTGLINGDVIMGAGNDTFVNKGDMLNGVISGGDGDDTYRIDHASGYILENALGGDDRVFASVSFDADGSSIERITLTGRRNVNATGSAEDNRLLGNAGSNKIAGLDGKDRLDGKGGDDRLWGGAEADWFVFRSDGSRDTIMDYDDLNDTIDISRLNGITGITDLKKNHLIVDGLDLIIFDGETRIIIKNTDKAELDSTDFDFGF